MFAKYPGGPETVSPPVVAEEGSTKSDRKRNVTGSDASAVREATSQVTVSAQPVSDGHTGHPSASVRHDAVRCYLAPLSATLCENALYA